MLDLQGLRMVFQSDLTFGPHPIPVSSGPSLCPCPIFRDGDAACRAASVLHEEGDYS